MPAQPLEFTHTLSKHARTTAEAAYLQLVWRGSVITGAMDDGDAGVSHNFHAQCVPCRATGGTGVLRGRKSKGVLCANCVRDLAKGVGESFCFAQEIELASHSTN